MKHSILAAAIALATLPVAASAQQMGEPHVGVGISTMGAVIQGGFRITPSFGARALYAGLPTIRDTVEIDDIDYDIQGRLGGLALLGDYFPGDMGVRISAGIFVPNSELKGDVTASASNPIEVGAATFNSGETVNTNTTFKNDVAPMATIGYVYEMRNNMFLSAEAGVIYTGGFDVQVQGTGVPQANLDQEAANVRDELNKYKVLPYVQLMAGFRF